MGSFCGKCGNRQNPGARFCGSCGAPQAAASPPPPPTCVNCGNQVTPSAAFCGHCGAKASAAKAPRDQPAARVEPLSERSQPATPALGLETFQVSRRKNEHADASADGEHVSAAVDLDEDATVQRVDPLGTLLGRRPTQAETSAGAPEGPATTAVPEAVTDPGQCGLCGAVLMANAKYCAMCAHPTAVRNSPESNGVSSAGAATVTSPLLRTIGPPAEPIVDLLAGETDHTDRS